MTVKTHVCVMEMQNVWIFSPCVIFSSGSSKSDILVVCFATYKYIIVIDQVIILTQLTATNIFNTPNGC